MAKFTAHTAVHRESGTVFFAPGDEVPEWAEGKVGDHVIDVAPAEAPDFTEASDAAVQEGDADAEVPTEPEADAAPIEAPDFTAPAKPRRGRPRKDS